MWNTYPTRATYCSAGDIIRKDIGWYYNICIWFSFSSMNKNTNIVKISKSLINAWQNQITNLDGILTLSIYHWLCQYFWGKIIPVLNNYVYNIPWKVLFNMLRNIKSNFILYVFWSFIFGYYLNIWISIWISRIPLVFIQIIYTLLLKGGNEHFYP